MKLIVWLGNPGDQYKNTRHNAWFIVLEEILKSVFSLTLKYDSKLQAEVWETTFEWEKIIFLKPMNFMNRSGVAISYVANFYKIQPENILVIHDEIDYPAGIIKFKLWWSSAWHNWLKSIIEKLWTNNFWRIRIWVDRPENKEQVVDYVLGKLSKQDKQKIDDKIDEIVGYIKNFLESK